MGEAKALTIISRYYKTLHHVVYVDVPEQFGIEQLYRPLEMHDVFRPGAVYGLAALGHEGSFPFCMALRPAREASSMRAP